MPIYEYRCSFCGKDFELLVRSDTVPACPHCQDTHVERLISLPAAPGNSRQLLANARRVAAHEGHFSHFSASERAKIIPRR